MFGQMANLLNANMLQDPSNNPWLIQNAPGAALGRVGSALGAPGSALGGAPNMFNASLGAAPTTLGAGAGGTAGAAGNFSLTGAKGAQDLALKAPGSGFNFSSFAGMIPQAALATGLPQAIFGRTAGNALGQGASGALTGMAMGGPVGAGVGGGLGLLTSLASGKQGGQRPGMPVPVTQARPGLYENMV